MEFANLDLDTSYNSQKYNLKCSLKYAVTKLSPRYIHAVSDLIA
jgi:hypothetical protein